MTNETNSPASPEMPVVKLESTGLEAQTPSGGTVIGARTADGNGVGFIFTNVKGEVTNLATRWETFEAAISLFNELRAGSRDAGGAASGGQGDEPVYHLRSYGDVSKAQLDEYVSAPAPSMSQPDVQSVIDKNNAAFNSTKFRHTKMVPGDDLHLTFLMAPFSLNLVVGEDRVALLNFGRAVWAAARKDAGVSNE